MKTVTRLEADGTVTEVAPSAIPAQVLEGGIFVVPSCLAQFGHFSSIVELSHAVIREEVGPDRAREVETRGFEAIHELLSPSELMAVADRIQRRLEPVTPPLVRSLVHDVLGHGGNFFFERHPNVRFHVPFDRWQESKAAYLSYAKDHGEGKLSPHDPHRDGWYRCPENAINVWIALGRVQRGNGMCLYPDVYRREIRRTPKGSITHDQQLGRRVNFSLDPDDALIFHGSHLHGSELNRTTETRYVVSFRLTLSRPKVGAFSNHKYLWSRYDRGTLGRALGLGERVLRNVRPLLKQGFSQETDPALPIPRDLHVEENGTTLRFPASAVGPNAIVPLSKSLCAARVKGELIVFRRTCPHAAADLAMGSVSDNQIFCPEHNVGFDLRTGASPCHSLPKLRTLPCSEKDGQIIVSL